MADTLDLVARAQVQGLQQLRDLEKVVGSITQRMREANTGKTGLSAIWGEAKAGFWDSALKGLKDQEKQLMLQQQQHPTRLRQQRETITGWKTFREETERGAKAVQREMMPALSALGISTLTVGGSVALLVKSLKDFAEAGAEVNRARQLEFPEKIYSSWKAAGEAFYVAGDKMDTAFASVSRMRVLMTQMQASGELRRSLAFSGLGELVGQIDAINRSNLPTATKNVQTLATILTDLAKIEPRVGASGVRVLLQQIGLPEDLENITKSETALREFVETAKAYEKAMGEAVDPAAALQYNIQIGLLTANFEGLKRALGHELLGPFTQLITKAKEFVELNKGEFAHGIADMVTGLGDAIRQELPSLEQLQTAIEFIQKFNAAHQGSPAQSAAGWIREHGGQQVGDFLQQNVLPGGALPGVDTVRGAVGLPPIGGGLTGDDVAKMQNYGGAAPERPAQPAPAQSWWDRAFGMGKPAATRPQMFREQREAPDIESSFAPGSLGMGDISQGWRHSTGVEDQRSVEDKIADERTWRGLSDNTTEERNNTEQLRRLTEILQGMGGQAGNLPVMGGFGGGGTGAYGHTGSGPMFRPGRRGAGPGGVGRGPGIGPGAARGRVEPVYRPPEGTVPAHPGHTPGATETPGPRGGTPAPNPASSIPPPSMMPSVPKLAEGGIVTQPTFAMIGEKGPEAVLPIGDYDRLADAIMKQEGYGRAGAIPTVNNNPGDIKPGPFASSHGATGVNRGHAVFPDFATGRGAMISLLQEKYAGKSIEQIGGHGRGYAEDTGWAARVAENMGVPLDYVPKGGGAGAAGPEAQGWKKFGLAGQGGGDLAMRDKPEGAGLGPSDTKGVDPQLVDILNETSKSLPEGYTARILSGRRTTPAWSYHTRGEASDVQLYDPKGDKIDWYQNANTYRTYQAFAEKAHEVASQKYPDFPLSWGGYFSGNIPTSGLGPGATQGPSQGKYGVMDLMHFSRGEGQVAGNWAEGLKPEWQARWGVPDKKQGQSIFDKSPKEDMSKWGPAAPITGRSGLSMALPGYMYPQHGGNIDLGFGQPKGRAELSAARAATGPKPLSATAMDPNAARSPREETIRDPGAAGQFTPHDPGKLGGGTGSEHKFSGQGTLNIKVQGPPGTKASGNFSEMVDQKSNGPFRKVNIGHHMLHKADEGN